MQENGEFFGNSIAISGNYAIVGAPIAKISGQINAGAAYIFERDNSGNWGTAVSGQNYRTETIRLEEEYVSAGVYFGNDVAIDGNYAIVSRRKQWGIPESAYF